MVRKVDLGAMMAYIHLGLWIGALALSRFCLEWWHVYQLIFMACLWTCLWRWWRGYWPRECLAVFIAAPWTFQPEQELLQTPRVYRGTAEVIDQRLLLDSTGAIWASSRKLPLNARIWIDSEVHPWDLHPVPWAFDAKEIYGSRGARGQIKVLKLDSLGAIDRHSERAASRWRQWLLKQPWPQDLKGLSLALSVGDRRWLSKAWRQRFQSAGLAHVLALSGFHLGLVTLLFRASRSWLPFRLRPWWMLVGALSTWWLVMLVGSASLVRAAVFLTVMQFLRLLPFRIHGMTALHFAASLLILWRPELTGQLGFQLSVLAVMGIVGGRVPRGKSWLGKVASGMLIAWVAQVVTMSRTLSVFHQVPVHFLWTNVLLVPVVLVIYPLLFVAILISSLGVAIPIDEVVMMWMAQVFDMGSGVWGHRFPDVWLQIVMAISAILMIASVRQRNWWRGLLWSFVTFVAVAWSSGISGDCQFAYRKGRGIAWVEINQGCAVVRSTEGLSLNDWTWNHEFQPFWRAMSVDSVERHAVSWKALDSLFDHHQIPASQGFHWVSPP